MYLSAHDGNATHRMCFPNFILFADNAAVDLTYSKNQNEEVHMEDTYFVQLTKMHQPCILIQNRSWKSRAGSIGTSIGDFHFSLRTFGAAQTIDTFPGGKFDRRNAISTKQGHEFDAKSS